MFLSHFDLQNSQYSSWDNMVKDNKMLSIIIYKLFTKEYNLKKIGNANNLKAFMFSS